jgi:kinesin family protein 5
MNAVSSRSHSIFIVTVL